MVTGVPLPRSCSARASRCRSRTIRAADGSGRQEGRRCSFGIIGDIQYADCDDGSDFSGSQPRFFRHTLDLVRDAVKRWVSEDKVDFAVQLGDAIDGRNAGISSQEALATVLREFPDGLPRVDLLGNHELYNFQRTELVKSGLRLFAEGLPGATRGGNDDEVSQGEACYFHFPADGEGGKWEVIVLDAYDVACIGYPEGHPRRNVAEAILAQTNPRAFQKGVDWFDGLPVEQHRFVPYNGLIGPSQLAWLRGRLEACYDAGRTVIVLTHVPLLEESTTPKTVIWNAEEVLNVLRSAEGRCVLAVLAGHDHDGGYAVDPMSGIHHVTCLSPLICAPGSGRTGAATVDCYDGWMELRGHGIFCAESGTRAQGQTYDLLRLGRCDPRGW